MKKTVLLIALFIGLAFAQPDTLWTRTFGGSDTDYGNSVQQTADGGYIITGFTESFGNGSLDVWLIKTNPNGNEEWNQTFGGSEYDRGYSVQQTTDGGYIIVGVTSSFGNGQNDIWLIKTDFEGNEEWSKTFGGASMDEQPYGHQTIDGGYIITGNTASYGNGSSDIWLIKTNSDGEEEWNRTFGGSNYDHGNFVQQTADGGYIVTGTINMMGGAYENDVLLIKTDSNGNEEWNRTFDGNNGDEGLCVKITTDNGYIITGTTNIGGTNEGDLWLIKTNSYGNEEWRQTFGGNDYDEGNFVVQTIDGGYIITGHTWSFGNGSGDVWLIKTDSDGNEEWSQTFGASSSSEESHSIGQTIDGGYIIAGSTYYYENGNQDVYLIRLEGDDPLGIMNSELKVPKTFTLSQNYPNPFNPTTSISFSIPQSEMVSMKVYDLNGRLIETLLNDFYDMGNHAITWDGSYQSSGIYFVRLESGEFIQTRKVVLVK